MLAAVKFVLRGVLVLVILIVLAGGLAFLFVDRLIAGSIEKGATYATGVETKVGGIDASLFAGALAIDELSIANPPGFRPEPFVRLSSTRAAWENGTILSDAIHVREFVVDGVAINLELVGGKTNYGTILEHVKRVSPAGDGTQKDSGKSRTLKIDRIVIRNVKTALHISGVPGASGSLQAEVPEIVVENFDSSGSTGEIVAKLTRVVIEALLSSSLKAGRGVFPDNLLKDLGGELDGLKQTVKEQAEGMLKGLEKELGGAEELLKGAGDLFKKDK